LIKLDLTKWLKCGALEQMPKPKKRLPDTPEKQHGRFRKIAKELGADESPKAMDRAFASLDTRKKAVKQK
jgi:hypothetical protein